MIRILFYLSISMVALSQDLIAQQDRIDSLNRVLMQENVNDSIRIKNLNKLATLYRRNNRKRGDSLYRLAITLARRSKNPYGEIRALVGLTKFQREDGNFSE